MKQKGIRSHFKTIATDSLSGFYVFASPYIFLIAAFLFAEIWIRMIQSLHYIIG